MVDACKCFLDKTKSSERTLTNKIESLILQFEAINQIPVAENVTKSNNEEWSELKFKNPNEAFVIFLSKEGIELKSCFCK